MFGISTNRIDDLLYETGLFFSFCCIKGSILKPFSDVSFSSLQWSSPTRLIVGKKNCIDLQKIAHLALCVTELYRVKTPFEPYNANTGRDLRYC